MNFGWMDVGMLLGCAPIFFLRRADGSTLWDGFQIGRCGFCLFGMVIGMNLGALLVGGLTFSSSQVQFMVNFAAMCCGMLLGMGVLEKVGEEILKRTVPRKAV